VIVKEQVVQERQRQYHDPGGAGREERLAVTFGVPFPWGALDSEDTCNCWMPPAAKFRSRSR